MWPAPARGRRLFLLGLLHHGALGRDDDAGDRGRVLQRRAGHLRGVEDPGLEHVDPLAGRGVVAARVALACGSARRSPRPRRRRCCAIRRAGSASESRTILAPVASSPVRSSLSSAASARISATPPPGTMPSSIAARVADSASSIRCFFSFSSTSVAAPTLTTATPPASLASRSWSFSRSQSESVFSISALIWSIRPLTSSSAPPPSTIVVSSFVTTTLRAVPSRSSPTFSSFRPTSSEMTCAAGQGRRCPAASPCGDRRTRAPSPRRR